MLQMFFEVTIFQLGSPVSLPYILGLTLGMAGATKGQFQLEIPLALFWCIFSPYQNLDMISSSEFQKVYNSTRDNVKLRIHTHSQDVTDSLFYSTSILSNLFSQFSMMINQMDPKKEVINDFCPQNLLSCQNIDQIFKDEDGQTVEFFLKQLEP